MWMFVCLSVCCWKYLYCLVSLIKRVTTLITRVVVVISPGPFPLWSMTYLMVLVIHICYFLPCSFNHDSKISRAWTNNATPGLHLFLLKLYAYAVCSHPNFVQGHWASETSAPVFQTTKEQITITLKPWSIYFSHDHNYSETMHMYSLVA